MSPALSSQNFCALPAQPTIQIDFQCPSVRRDCSAGRLSGWRGAQNRATLGRMLDLVKLIFGLVLDLLRSRAALEAEILVLRQQIIVLRRGRVGRLPSSASDRLVLGWVCGLSPKTCGALAIIRPETVMRWHRAGFRSYWRWRSRRDRAVPRCLTNFAN